LRGNEDFDFQKHNVDVFLKEKKLADKEAETVRGELKSVQRMFRMVPNYSKTLALRQEKIHSAQSIVATGKKRFVTEIAPKAGIGEAEAEEIFRKAEVRHTGAMLLIGDLQDSMSVADIAAFETKSLALKLESVSKDFPDLKSLFKLVDTCECEHCRSVYSPAAYLVELLQFLEKRMVVAGNAKTVLFGRRPDLGNIDLGCENANTPVKYIDLVCELLEEAIAPDPGIDFTGVLSDGPDPLKGKISNALFTELTTAGLPVTAEALIFETESNLSADTLPHYLRDTALVCKIENTDAGTYKVFRLRQTLSPAEELDAAPEYVNMEAYNTLRTKHYAFKLPFDLAHTEANSYFSRFDISRAVLMQAFQSTGVPADATIAAERLGLTDAVRTNITSTPVPNNNAAQQLYWNVPAPGNVLNYLKQVDHFLEKTDLSYKELDLLLKFPFIDTNGNLFVRHNDLSCDTAEKEIANLDLPALDRLHRFLRLQKKTGWKMELLSEIISQSALGNGVLDDSCLIKAAQLKELAEKTNIKIEDLIGFFGDIPFTIWQENSPKPLYYQVFYNKAKNGSVDENFLPDKVDGSQLLNSFTGYIATCLQLKQKDLELLFPLLPDGNLTSSNLSYLLGAARLIKKMKVKAGDFAILATLSGIDFWESPAKMLEFVKLIKQFSQAPLKAADVRFFSEPRSSEPGRQDYAR
jgi:hypothetical protein